MGAPESNAVVEFASFGDVATLSPDAELAPAFRAKNWRRVLLGFDLAFALALSAFEKPLVLLLRGLVLLVFDFLDGVRVDFLRFFAFLLVLPGELGLLFFFEGAFLPPFRAFGLRVISSCSLYLVRAFKNTTQSRGRFCKEKCNCLKKPLRELKPVL